MHLESILDLRGEVPERVMHPGGSKSAWQRLGATAKAIQGWAQG